MNTRPEYCPCENEKPDPCPACGATVANGVCRARHNGPKPEPLIRLVLTHRDTGEVV